MTAKEELVAAVRAFYAAGYTTSVSGNHSIRSKGWMWITPSGTPRYRMRLSDLVRINLRTGTRPLKAKPSIEADMHLKIYAARPDVLAIAHTHSPYTIAVSISSEFIHVIEEAKLIVGDPVVVPNAPSGSQALAKSVAHAFASGANAVVIKNHGVVAAGANIHAARAIIESLEEWSKILVLSKILGGPSVLLSS
ncbi:MAG TPA: class II aldolase/adducin family protein [Nitrososphaera sp.]|nr:class II aldolase/adducin family protein [Nitrososphaera sp.]